MRLRLLFLLVLIFCPSFAQATIIDIQEWSTLPGGNWAMHNGWSLDASAPSPSGGSAMYLPFPAGTWGQGAPSLGGDFFIQNIGSYNDLWYGMWVKYSSNWVWNRDGTKLVYANYPKAPTGQSGDQSASAVAQFGGNMQYGDGTIFNRVSQDWNDCCGNLVGPTSGSAFPVGAWRWVQHHVTLGSRGQFNGTWQTWIGDPNTGVSTQLVNRVGDVGFLAPTAMGTAFTYMQVGLIYGGGTNSTPAQGLWIDHTVFATTQSETNMPGGGGGGGGTDTTPPAVPTLLAVH